MYKKNIYKSVVVYYWFVVTNASLALPTFLPTFHRSVAWSSERHNTPSYKIRVHGGNRTPISRVSTPGRKHLTTLVNPCLAWSDLGYSYPRHLASLSQILRPFVVFKILSQILRLFVVFKIRVATHWRQACHHDWQCQTCRPRIVAKVRDSSRSWLTMSVVTFLTVVGVSPTRQKNSNWQKFIWYCKKP